MAMSAELFPLALAGLAAAACTPVCDEAGLRRAAGMFAAADAAGRRDGLVALREACPTLPPTVRRSLAAEPMTADERLRFAADCDADPVWQQLLARTCPQPPRTDGEVATLAELQWDLRERCGLDRYGLLAADAPLAPDDLAAFVLHEWLVGGAVDPAAASAVARSLLTTTAHATRGVAPPRARTTAPLEVRPELRVSPTELAVEGVPVLPLAGGRPAAGAFVDHHSATLAAALATTARQGRELAARDDRAWDEELAVLADRDTPFATIGDALWTASRVGFRGFLFVVHDGRELHAHHVGTPYRWYPIDPDIKAQRPLDVVFVVDRTHVALRIDHGELNPLPAPRTCDPPPAVCHDLAAVADAAARTKELFPNEVVVQLRVAGDVPLQAVVALMDAIAGPDCEIDRALRGERVPDECRFWQPVLDFEPPLRHDPTLEPRPAVPGPTRGFE